MCSHSQLESQSTESPKLQGIFSESMGELPLVGCRKTSLWTKQKQLCTTLDLTKCILNTLDEQHKSNRVERASNIMSTLLYY